MLPRQGEKDRRYIIHNCTCYYVKPNTEHFPNRGNRHHLQH